VGSALTKCTLGLQLKHCLAPNGCDSLKRCPHTQYQLLCVLEDTADGMRAGYTPTRTAVNTIVHQVRSAYELIKLC